MKNIVRLMGTGLFKGAALIGGVAIIVAMLAYDSPYLVWGLDWNLKALKWMTAQMPSGLGNRTETLLRLWGFERPMLFVELVTVVKLFMLVIGRIFRPSRT